MGAICDGIWRRFRSENLRTKNLNRNLRKRKEGKEEQRRARCRCARSNERGNVLGLRLRSHSDCSHTTGFHSGGCSHLWPVPCPLEEVSYPLRYVAFILTRRDGLFSWPLCVHTYRQIPTYMQMPSLKGYFAFTLGQPVNTQMASLYGFFAFTLTSRFPLTVNGLFAWPLCVHTYTEKVTYMQMVFLVSHLQSAGLFVFTVTARWPLYVHTPHILMACLHLHTEVNWPVCVHTGRHYYWEEKKSDLSENYFQWQFCNSKFAKTISQKFFN